MVQFIQHTQNLGIRPFKTFIIEHLRRHDSFICMKNQIIIMNIKFHNCRLPQNQVSRSNNTNKLLIACTCHLINGFVKCNLRHTYKVDIFVTDIHSFFQQIIDIIQNTPKYLLRLFFGHILINNRISKHLSCTKNDSAFTDSRNIPKKRFLLAVQFCNITGKFFFCFFQLFYFFCRLLDTCLRFLVSILYRK